MGNDHKPGRNGQTTIYVGCALTHAPEEFRQTVAKLKDTLRKLGFEILEFFDLKAGSPADVTRHDLKQVTNCHLMVGIADWPALGLGAELMYQVRVCRKPALVLAHVSCRLSRFVEGMTILAPNMEVRRYQSWEEIPAIIMQFCEFHGLRPTATLV